MKRFVRGRESNQKVRGESFLKDANPSARFFPLEHPLDQLQQPAFSSAFLSRTSLSFSWIKDDEIGLNRDQLLRQNSQRLSSVRCSGMRLRSFTAVSVPERSTYFPFCELPLELRTRIVELVDQQDAEYRDRKARRSAYAHGPRIITWINGVAVPLETMDPDPEAGVHNAYRGKGLLQLAFCCRELARLVTPLLYSVSARATYVLNLLPQIAF